MNKQTNVIDLDTRKMNQDEMSINNPVLAPIRNKLDAAIVRAAHVANGLNQVTVTMKLTIDEVEVLDGEKYINSPKWSVKVNAKANVYDEGQLLSDIIVTVQDGYMLAIDAKSRQISMDELDAEGQ